MRFEISRVLDTIERCLTTDPAVARGIVEVGEVIRYVDLDNGRPASLLRLGYVIDALARQVAEEGVAVYAVVDRSVLSDGDLTSNERMVLRRWADDGLVEVLASAGDRVFEVADLTGLPVLTRRDLRGLTARYPWLVADPGRLLTPVAGGGGAMLRAPGGVASPVALTHPVLSRLWRCPEPGCESFGPGRTAGQPPPRMRAGVPTCARHEHPLADVGPRPPAVTLAIRVDGVVRRRFAVTAGVPVTVGRDPADERGVRLGPWLTGDALLRVSRSHLVVSLGPSGLEVRDTSTNGTVIRGAHGDVKLERGGTHVLGETDVVELHSGVELARASRWRSGGVVEPRSVMSDAPTIAMRRPLS
jgi:hypothetical protein